MRALVISGGGSKGAFAGGVAQYLIQDLGIRYKLFVGTSTGSTLIPHLAGGRIEKVKRISSNLTQLDIFSNCPFRITRNKQGQKSIGIDHINVLKNFFTGSKTFGESFNLRNTIRNTFTKDDFKDLIKSDVDVVVTVSNLSLHRLEYKSIKECTYDQFCDWIWVSCNFVPFMSLAHIDGYDYADGSFGVSVAIEEAIRRGATQIDAIVLEVEHKSVQKKAIKNPFALLSSIFSFTKDVLEAQNIQVAKDFAKKKQIDLNFYYTPYKLTSNPLIFEPEEMEKWWGLGYEYAKQIPRID